MAEILSKISATMRRRKGTLALLVLVAGAAIAAYFIWGGKAAASDFILGKVERGNVEVNVSATGTVQAVVTVQVGSQVSGTVQWLGADFNSQVKRGQLIARLDPAIFQAQVDNAKASMQNAEAAINAAQTDIVNQQANVKAAQANVEVTRVQRDDALDLVKRNEGIKNVISSRDVEAARATANAAAARYEQAAAQVGQVQAALASSRAKLEQAKAALAQAKAQLQLQQANLDHSIISSPIDGVVVSRNVDVGQTVAASLQAPTLFTIANDLTKMQVLASIDEADVGQIKQGIRANFNVDAFPGEVFSGNISQLRLNSQSLQNVVTYSAVIEVANPDLKLRPGMTANITVPVARRDDVLTVPNAALRFKRDPTDKEQQALDERRKQYIAERQAQGGGDQGSAGQGEQAGGGAAAGQPGSQPANQPPAAGQQASGEGRHGRGGRDAQPGAEGQPPSGQPAGQSGPSGGQRHRPDAAQDAGQPQGQGEHRGGQGAASAANANAAGSPASSPSGNRAGGQRRQGQIVWVLTAEKQPEPRWVRTGLTNGRVTEIVAGEL